MIQIEAIPDVDHALNINGCIRMRKMFTFKVESSWETKLWQFQNVFVTMPLKIVALEIFYSLLVNSCVN